MFNRKILNVALQTANFYARNLSKCAPKNLVCMKEQSLIYKTTQCFAFRSLSTSVPLETETKSFPSQLPRIMNTIKKNCEEDIKEKKIFAVVYLSGKQFKIAINDMVMIHKKIEADCGDIIRLEKVLAVGSKTFTLLGQPLLKRELVNVEAIVMEKTKGEKKIVFKKKRRKGYKKWQGHRQDLSVLKITSINVDSSVL